MQLESSKEGREAGTLDLDVSATAGWDLQARRWGRESQRGLVVASPKKQPSGPTRIPEKKCLLGRLWVRWKSPLWGHDLRWVCWESGGVV